MPGYRALSNMVLNILRGDLGTSGRAIVLGADGENELLSFAMEGWDITGIDPSSRMLQLGEQRLPRTKPRLSIHLVNERFENMEKEEEFDAAFYSR